MSESAIKKFFTKLAPSKSQIIDKGLCEILRKFSKNYNNKNEKKKHTEEPHSRTTSCILN